MDIELISLLFKTNAFKVSEPENPFWYTSGKIGPYFINVDYLYGSQKDSASLLKTIDELLVTTSKLEIPGKLNEIIMEQYNSNQIFKIAIDKLVDYIEKNIEYRLIDYISGGERRDWIFSIPVANLLGKPHVTIYKDLTTIVSTSDFEEATQVTHLPGNRMLHVADILNTGSSFERAWVPAINSLGSKINWAIYTVDRNQNGAKNLLNLEIQPYSLIKLDKELFSIAKENNIISKNQENLLDQYFDDPEGTMRAFINANPNFIDNTIKSGDEKSAKRAKLCKEKNWYGSTLG